MILLIVISATFVVHADPPQQGPISEGKIPTPAANPSTEPMPYPDGKSILIRLAVGQFDPLSGAGLPELAAELSLAGYPDDGTGYYLVQFKGPITEADKAVLTKAGAQIFDYIPDFTFVTRMNSAAKAILEATSNVRWIGLYQPAFRIEPALLKTYTTAEQSHTSELTVLVFKGEDVAQVASQVEALGGTVLEVAESEWKGRIKVVVGSDRLGDIARISGVKWIEPAPEWQLFNNVAADIMDVRDVWNTHGLYGAGQTIAVCDTGLDRGSTTPASLHDDFEDGGGNSRVIQIFDRVGDGANDVNSGHGTHVAGSVLGNGARSGANPSTHTYPGSAYVGMAPEANLVFQAVENNTSGSLAGIPLDLNVLFAQADGAGADLHTNSWGAADNGSYTSYSQDVDEYIWSHKDFTILFAAGNQGTDVPSSDGVVNLDSIGSPATAKNCITVGASENNRSSGGYNPGGACSTYGSCWPLDYPVNPIRDDRLSNDPGGMVAFSSRGPTNDGRVKPDVVAPGTNIASVRSSMAASTGWGAINSYYMYMGGTSMSTPLTAGAAVLVRDFYQDNQGVTPSAALIKATLINGATDISPGQYGTGSTQEIPDPPRPNNVEGWGRVNLENSIFPAAPRTLNYDDHVSGLGTGGMITYVYTATTAGQPMRTTLVWSDYPGTPAADGGLVNDLDLSITTPAGTTLRPSDHVNNVEGIDIASAASGVYTITVRGYNVPLGPQPYALVVSGAGELGQSDTSASWLLTYLPVIFKAASNTPPPPSLANGDFEAGQDGSWTEYSTHGWSLILHSGELPVSPHSGDWAVWLGGDFDETSYIQQAVTVASAQPYLEFYYWIASEDFCGYDYGYVRVNGSSLKTYSLCNDNNTGGWVNDVINLSSYAGQTVSLQIRAEADSSLNSNWFIDDAAFQSTSSTATDASQPPMTPSPADLSSYERPRR
ncbi:MAG: hypothetical protein Kow0063_00140 [Anaerolineae bacterium]